MILLMNLNLKELRILNLNSKAFSRGNYNINMFAHFSDPEITLDEIKGAIIE